MGLGQYAPPTIEILKVFVERGYNASSGENNGGGLGLPEWGII